MLACGAYRCGLERDRRSVWRRLRRLCPDGRAGSVLREIARERSARVEVGVMSETDLRGPGRAQGEDGTLAGFYSGLRTRPVQREPRLLQLVCAGEAAGKLPETHTGH